MKDNTVLTPNAGVLRGITRKTVLEIAEHLNLKKEMREISKTEFFETDEVFIATSAGGITPIVKVDNRIYSNGQIGEITKRIATTYLEWIREPKFRTEIDYSLAINT